MNTWSNRLKCFRKWKFVIGYITFFWYCTVLQYTKPSSLGLPDVVQKYYRPASSQLFTAISASQPSIWNHFIWQKNVEKNGTDGRLALYFPSTHIRVWFSDLWKIEVPIISLYLHPYFFQYICHLYILLWQKKVHKVTK